ncbi:hypothetical protein PUNSTDRAFT_41756 [Punctularia strigosozonata HHB-11173 SS5]|uniref:uncharacterized protein n=1 Tax=Punctularia strigosozonata (strain HHB-11173) TaxID=741275 RepID=UPI00044179E3|nr:uncharacterized protein PUNSTDRAFT_41756 [Punctularia strigosozonata HHB-11173 SS5]EIN14600.1 hypothetical protein PUNSTDRAFT_41756 [Punctularia strigosozonata HHB-11173 SS5]
MTVVEEVAILKQRAKRKAEGGKISPFLLNLAELEDEYHNVWLSPDHRVHILMPLYPGGDLRRYYNYINDIQMQLIIAELGTVVITDFGAARRMEPGKQTMRTTSEMVLSEAYTAPELAAVFDTASPGQSEYNSLVDMWSLGVTIVALIRGKDFEEGEEIWVRAPVSNARLRMFVSGHALWPDKLWDFLCASDPASIAQGLLESDITKRTNEDYAIWADPYMENLADLYTTAKVAVVIRRSRHALQPDNSSTKLQA